MTWFKNTTLSNVDDLLNALSTALVAEGWTQYEANGLVGTPGANRIGKERIFKAPDTADHPGGFLVGLCRFTDNSSNALNTGTSTPKIALNAYQGWSGLKAITSITRSGTTVTVVCVGHGFQTGWLVGINGTSNTSFHVGATPESAITAEQTPNTITRIDADTFTYQTNGSGALSGTGGYAFAVFNPAGFRAAPSNGTNYSSARIPIPSDAACQVYGYVDKLRICGIVIQGLNYRYFHAGMIDRRHVPSTQRSVGRLSAPVTGDGTTKTLNLDRACPNLQVGQTIWYVDQNSPRPDVTGTYWSSLHTVTIAAINSPTQITAVVPNGVTYPAGTLIGRDPCPLFVLGQYNSGTYVEDINGYFTHNADGTRAANNLGSVGWTRPVESNTNEAKPDVNGDYRIYDVMISKAVAGATSSRGPLIGFNAGNTNGVPALLDIYREGAAVAAPAADWACFPGLVMNGANSIPLIGPGAV